MISNIIKTSLRFFFKHKSYSLINIFGLAVGLATCILIFLFVQDELSYDNYHKDAENVYRLESHWIGEGEESHWAATVGSIIPFVTANYPEITSGVKLHFNYGSTIFRFEEKIFSESNILSTDSSFFDIFSFNVFNGSLSGALSGPGKIVLTESAAKRYFGKDEPIGKILTANENSYVVSAVIQDVPRKSHFHFDLIISMDDMRARWSELDDSGPSAFYSYLRLPDEKTKNFLKQKIDTDIWEMYGYTISGDSANIPEGYTAEMIFNPITDIHLNGHAEKEIESNSNIQYVYIFSIIAMFVLIIACINYMNLATARSARRSREVGIRKVMGANKSNIFNQFMAESFFMSIFSMIIAIVIVEIVLPSFNILIGKQLDLNLLSNIPLTVLIFVITFIVGFLSGSYPAFFLSNFKPLSVLKSNTIAGNGSKTTLYLRRGLVIFQFAISSLLIIGSITVYKQLIFIQEKNLGFDKEQVMVIPLSGRNVRANVEVLKNDFLSMPEITSACATSVIPGQRIHFLSVRIPDIAEDNLEGNEEGDDVFTMRVMNADIDVVETFGLEIVDGRSFSRDFVSDPDKAFLLNEAAVKEFELEDPVGKRFEYVYGLPEPKAGHIVGIVKDFHYASLHTEVEPLMIHVFPGYYRYLSVKLKTDNVQKVVENVEEKWKKVSSDIPFDYFFLDASYDNLYKSEMNMGKIVTYFTALAILIACLGLFGLASYITEQRTKEIGIRKVLGASMGSIMKVLSTEFVILVLIANIISWIPAWYFLNNWLDGFAFRINISLIVFALTATISLFIALLTVSTLALKTAKANPIDALKYE